MKKYAVEQVGSFEGVVIPAWLRFFDCRTWDLEESDPRAPWGEILYGCARAEVDLGLKTGHGSGNATTPRGSSSVHIDNRSRTDLSAVVREMIATAEEARAEYEAAAADPDTDNGCGVYFAPVAVALSNFGWTVIADRRQRVVR